MPSQSSVSTEEPSVRFRAPNGSWWRVFETSDLKRDARSLIFASDDGFRRVRDYPSHWAELDSEALWELSWRR